MKLARYATGREKFIAFYGGFHGRTIGALCLRRRRRCSARDSVRCCPEFFMCCIPIRITARAGEAREAYCEECASYIERELFKRVVDPKDVAAIVIEPIQGEGGYLPAPSSLAKSEDPCPAARNSSH